MQPSNWDARAHGQPPRLGVLKAERDAGQHEATLIVGGISPASAFEEERAINVLDDPASPNGGAAFHVWLRVA